MRKRENLVDLEKSEQMRLLLLSEASTQKRPSLQKCKGEGFSAVVILFSPAAFHIVFIFILTRKSFMLAIRSYSSQICCGSGVKQRNSVEKMSIRTSPTGVLSAQEEVDSKLRSQLRGKHGQLVAARSHSPDVWESS